MSEATRKPFTCAQLVQYTGLTVLFFLLLIICIGELFLRITYVPQAHFNKAYIDKTFGWLPNSNFDAKYKIKNYGDSGDSYSVHYQTQDNGFRIWGDPNSSRKKLFFIGDSYTQAVEVGNEDTFYHLLGNSLDMEVFAFGQAGFGSLQQTMILEKYIDEINPDLVIWQSCDNDFIDNYAPLEYNSKYGVGLRRPYLTANGEIIYRQAKPRWQAILDKSKFLGLLRRKWQGVFPKAKGPLAEELIAHQARAYPSFNASVEITSLILKRMKIAAGHRPLIGFSSSPYQPQLSTFSEIASANAIPFDTTIALQIRDLKRAGQVVNSSGGFHWNILGHQKAAEYLKDYIAEALPLKTIAIE